MSHSIDKRNEHDFKGTFFYLKFCLIESVKKIADQFAKCSSIILLAAKVLSEFMTQLVEGEIDRDRRPLCQLPTLFFLSWRRLYIRYHPCFLKMH